MTKKKEEKKTKAKAQGGRGSTLQSCNCTSEFQDRTYGTGQRVHTNGKEVSGNVPLVCTVCGTKR